MPDIKFLPENRTVNVPKDTKILIAALKNKVPIRYGCGSCQCGTCGIEIVGDQSGLEPMRADEEALLLRINLKTDGTIRLACRAKVTSGATRVNLEFQNKYNVRDRT